MSALVCKIILFRIDASQKFLVFTVYMAKYIYGKYSQFIVSMLC